MPIIQQNQLDPALRAKTITAHKTRLRDALSDPTISSEKRAWLISRLKEIEVGKVYKSDSPAPAGAIELGPVLPSDLGDLKKVDVMNLAQRLGVDISSSATKAQVIDRLRLEFPAG